MGLMDVLNGMQNGPHGQRGPATSSGMSPITMALLGLLAYKTLKSFTSQPSAPAAPAPKPGMSPGGTPGGLGGSLGDILTNGLGRMIAGGAAGGILGGGLNDLLHQFQQAGQGETANSWVGHGPNRAISSDDLAKALSPDQINALIAHSGLSRQELLDGLSQHLPEIVDHLTPNGRLPTGQELSQSV
ncbi:MAG TPA: YidB family protein [Xanthobacteraceae bacterium]